MRDRKFKIIAVVPAYNEAETIGNVVREIVMNLDVDVCVVDDGSTDNTSQIARNAGATVLRHPVNAGIGTTVQSGFLFALRNGYDIALQVDGDGQHDPKYISNLIEPIINGDADVVNGSRFLNDIGYKSSFMRRVGIAFFRFIYKLLTGKTVTDCTSGFRAFGRNALEFLAKNYPDDYPEPEVILTLLKKGFRFKEVPVVMRERQGGKSSLSGIFKPVNYMVKVTLALLIDFLRRNK